MEVFFVVVDGFVGLGVVFIGFVVWVGFTGCRVGFGLGFADGLVVFDVGLIGGFGLGFWVVGCFVVGRKIVVGFFVVGSLFGLTLWNVVNFGEIVVSVEEGFVVGGFLVLLLKLSFIVVDAKIVVLDVGIRVVVVRNVVGL